MSTSFFAIEDSFGFMTASANRVLQATLRREFRAAGLDLTPEQWGVLVTLWEKKSATQDELAQLCYVDKSTMSRTLSLMEDKGLVTRRLDPENERRKVICATGNAYEIREIAYAAANSVLHAALAGVSPEEVWACMKVFAAIKSNLWDKD